ncbi:MAG TPA: potassium-transporting ATPase subunit C, partial [Steroidobacteraceae bacterium]|nr:potassium-transporting ATPase subunit C [Steroidobacteraceae bacterium]
MKKNLITAILMTIATTILLGIMYPLFVTVLAQLIFPRQANGQLIQRDGKLVGSSILGQGFSGAAYFHSRPSAAGNGYDAANSNGSQYGPTNQKLIDRVNG